jgi:molecular chaperone DnaJ
LAGRGVPHLRTQERGDLIVTVTVETPQRLDERQTELLRELAALRNEEAPEGKVQHNQRSMFDRFKEAFK